MTSGLPKRGNGVATEALAAGGCDCGLIVTGASGWIGRAVVLKAHAQGLVVVAARRQPAKTGGVAEVRLDLDDSHIEIARQFAAVLKSAKSWAVVHCAGLAHMRNETGSVRLALHRVNVEGTEKLTKVCALVGIERFVQVSSIAVYDWADGRFASPRRESDSVGPSTSYAETKLKAEQVVEQSGLDSRVVRLATVFGVGDKANFARLAKAVRRGTFVVPGRGGQRKSCIDIDTAAESLIAIAKEPYPDHRLVNLAFPEAPTLGDIADRMAVACNAPLPMRVPEFIMRVAACAGGVASIAGLPAPLTPSDLKKLCASTWVDASRAASMIPALRQRTFNTAFDLAAQYYNEN
jgi:nucleoside-diphosphate-sugar epimerase